jgi:acetoacetate decarboxylase
MACKDIGRSALDLPPNKAARVAALLSEISSSDTVTRVAESVQLDSYANEVRRHIQDPDTEDVWDRLLAFLQDLQKSEIPSVTHLTNELVLTVL